MHSLRSRSVGTNSLTVTTVVSSVPVSLWAWLIPAGATVIATAATTVRIKVANLRSCTSSVYHRSLDLRHQLPP